MKDLYKIQKAIKFATKTHEVYQKQKRKGKDIPYITHPLSAGIILAYAGADADVVCAGILHDTVEDSIEEKKVSGEMLEQRFGERVASLVLDVDETLDEAVIREFFEETGFHVEVLDPVHCETSFFHPSHSKKHKDEYWNCPLLYFVVKKIGGELSTENFDEEEKEYCDMAEWINLSDINSTKFINSVDSVAIIKKAVKLIT